MKKRAILVFLIGCGIAIFFLPKEKVIDSEDFQGSIPKSFTVSLQGEVLFPGFYTFYEPKTILDIVFLAGGFTKKAETTNINLNEEISKDRILEIKKKSDEVIDQKIKYDINKVTFQELLRIPNMTENRSANFIIYRMQVGRINSVDELINVKNIGAVTFEKIKDYFYVS
ncbi:MAG: helix-hairpin-helix domain-containing protein [Acholeplasmatales bacterium]|jgi:competence protein ComEA|nr:helix-hairpin-helix domain-containing protein [Acholeplasmatales bacterium]